MNARAGRTEGEQSFDRYWAALAHVERRRCLLTLLDADGRVEMSVDVDDGTATTTRRRELAEVHLPALAELALIDWNPETRRVRRGPAFEAVEPLLQALPDGAAVETDAER